MHDLFNHQCVKIIDELTYKRRGVNMSAFYLCVHVFCINERRHKGAAWIDSVEGLASGRL